ncbi:MAG: RNA polymerase sigma factor [Bryobacteraceae bacterium]|nr:RNA polymerase sigma factor [Bryobacteraceae bacterium]
MEASDAALVALARSGDGDTFRVLVERHSRKVFRLAFRLTGNEQDSEDIVQETFLRAYRNLNSFDQRAVFSSWLYRIATNHALDVLRARRHRTAESLSAADPQETPLSERVAAPQPDPERLAMSARDQERIRIALDELTPQERAAFTLRHFEGYSIAEIQESLSISANAAKHAVFRAVQKMRRTLGEPEGVPCRN